MHEMSLVQSMLDIVSDYAAKEGFRKVNSLKLSCGKMSTVDEECLRFAFEVLSEGMITEGAILDIDFLPVVVYCLDCEQEFRPSVYTSTCPVCKKSNVLLTGGTEELKLIEMDVDNGD